LHVKSIINNIVKGADICIMVALVCKTNGKERKKRDGIIFNAL
jgi:hypothetical protein